MQLVIGNKLYSSWSMRPWLVMKAFGIDFEEILIPLDQPETAARRESHAPSPTVPILIDGDVKVWESLAIMEYLADRFPDKAIWPTDIAARTRSRPRQRTPCRIRRTALGLPDELRQAVRRP